MSSEAENGEQLRDISCLFRSCRLRAAAVNRFTTKLFGVPSAIGVSIGSSARAVRAAEGGLSAEDERPAAVGLTEAGEVVVGQGALDLPDKRRATGFVEQLGRHEPFIVAGAPYGAEALVAQLLRALVDSATARDGAADAIALAYADDLDSFRLDLLVEAVRLAAVGEVAFVPETITRRYAEDPASGAALWALDDERLTHAAAPSPTGTPVTARTVLIGGGAIGAAAGAGASTGGGAAAAGRLVEGFGAGASMADFGPSMETFAGRGRSMRGFLAAAVVTAVVVAGGAVALASRGGDDAREKGPRVTTTRVPTLASLRDPEVLATAITGKFTGTGTVVDGNDNFALGETFEESFEFAATCSAGSCELSIDGDAAVPLGGGLTFTSSGTRQDKCELTDVIVTTNVETDFKVEAIDASGLAMRISGTRRMATPEAASCGADTINDPIAIDFEVSRA